MVGANRDDDAGMKVVLPTYISEWDPWNFEEKLLRRMVQKTTFLVNWHRSTAMSSPFLRSETMTMGTSVVHLCLQPDSQYLHPRKHLQLPQVE